jgi:hypothetical protein
LTSVEVRESDEDESEPGGTSAPEPGSDESESGDNEISELVVDASGTGDAEVSELIESDATESETPLESDSVASEPFGETFEPQATSQAK